MSARAIDPIALEIQWQRLISIMDEVDNATVRADHVQFIGSAGSGFRTTEEQVTTRVQGFCHAIDDVLF